MKFEMVAARSSLERLLAESDATNGMYVRVHGKNLILGREETYGGANGRVDMVRLTERPGASTASATSGTQVAGSGCRSKAPWRSSSSCSRRA